MICREWNSSRPARSIGIILTAVSAALWDLCVAVSCTMSVFFITLDKVGSELFAKQVLQWTGTKFT
jgi:hypothetical protein